MKLKVDISSIEYKGRMKYCKSRDKIGESMTTLTMLFREKSESEESPHKVGSANIS